MSQFPMIRSVALAGTVVLGGCVTYVDRPQPVYESFPCANCYGDGGTVVYREQYYYDPWFYGPSYGAYYGPGWGNSYYDHGYYGQYYGQHPPHAVIVAPAHPQHPAQPPVAGPPPPAAPPPRFKPRDPGMVPNSREEPRRPPELREARDSREPRKPAPHVYKNPKRSRHGN